MSGDSNALRLLAAQHALNSFTMISQEILAQHTLLTQKVIDLVPKPVDEDVVDVLAADETRPAQ